MVNKTSPEQYLKRTGVHITQGDIDSIKGKQYVTNKILKLFIEKMTSHKYTFIDAQMYADIKLLLERKKTDGTQGMLTEVELGGIIETLREKD